MSASRSMPVSTPYSSSTCTRSSSARLPLAPGRERAAAEPADGAVDAVDTGLERGQGVGDAEAAGVVQVGADRDVAGERRRSPRRGR